MNLITDPWIPVQRRDGSFARIKPAEMVADMANNPAIKLAGPRPDFDGALIQFLIGLVQTAMTPSGDWSDFFEKPPSTAVLDEKFKRLVDYFNLDGAGPRFMQDFDLEDGTEVRISGLLIDAPGENALKNNTDHFIKRGGFEMLCPACAATALFSLQTNAPAGGAGHRTSLRGGGPLTTVLLADAQKNTTASLWHTVWLNIVDQDSLEATNCNPELRDDREIFPWIVPTKTSEKKGSAILPTQSGPLLLYWAMPRRIRLDELEMLDCECSVCAERSRTVYKTYRTKNYGNEYGDGFLHPLSPYYRDKETLRPYHPQPGGFTYRYWPQFVAEPGGGQSGERALVIKEVLRRAAADRSAGFEPPAHRFRVFGYDMDNMKARCW